MTAMREEQEEGPSIQVGIMLGPAGPMYGRVRLSSTVYQYASLAGSELSGERRRSPWHWRVDTLYLPRDHEALLLLAHPSLERVPVEIWAVDPLTREPTPDVSPSFGEVDVHDPYEVMISRWANDGLPAGRWVRLVGVGPLRSQREAT